MFAVSFWWQINWPVLSISQWCSMYISKCNIFSQWLNDKYFSCGTNIVNTYSLVSFSITICLSLLDFYYVLQFYKFILKKCSINDTLFPALFYLSSFQWNLAHTNAANLQQMQHLKALSIAEMGPLPMGLLAPFTHLSSLNLSGNHLVNGSLQILDSVTRLEVSQIQFYI